MRCGRRSRCSGRGVAANSAVPDRETNDVRFFPLGSRSREVLRCSPPVAMDAKRPSRERALVFPRMFWFGRGHKETSGSNGLSGRKSSEAATLEGYRNRKCRGEAGGRGSWGGATGPFSA